MVGRYAYTIYNEGGLLDANVAGNPWGTTGSSLNAQQQVIASRQGPAAFADLTQLPGLASTGAARAQQIVDSLVGWRSSATVQAQSSQMIQNSSFPNYGFGSYAAQTTLYLNYLLGVSNNFMSTANTVLDNPGGSPPSVSDRIFTGRQQLINFLVSNVAQGTTEQAELQDAMMYPAVPGTGLSNFIVEGERRFWVHVAIDRTTGQVIDENIEPVNE